MDHNHVNYVGNQAQEPHTLNTVHDWSERPLNKTLIEPLQRTPSAGTQNSYTCDSTGCDKSCSREQDLERHKACVHGNGKILYVCDFECCQFDSFRLDKANDHCSTRSGKQQSHSFSEWHLVPSEEEQKVMADYEAGYLLRRCSAVKDRDECRERRNLTQGCKLLGGKPHTAVLWRKVDEATHRSSPAEHEAGSSRSNEGVADREC
jgi:hypothetical protein